MNDNTNRDRQVDTLVTAISQQLGCPLPCMGIDETKRLYARIADLAISQVRAQVATEIEGRFSMLLPGHRAYTSVQQAAEIARGGAR